VVVAVAAINETKGLKTDVFKPFAVDSVSYGSTGSLVPDTAVELCLIQLILLSRLNLF
jgi:hypothetical protein